MGVTGGLVRSIFFRNKSFGAHDYNNGRSSNLGEKKRWSSVRSYLCGDEFNSVLADDDSVSLKSSEATVTQPLHVEDNQSEASETHIPKKHQTTPISKLFLEEDAAVIIQSAFRSYMAIRRTKEVEEKFDKEESFSGEESQGKVSMGTSLEVQTCNSVKAASFRRKRVSANRRTLQNSKAQVLRIKEDWDDSTVSSTISKSRIQSRIEAMTKRERALAYAFSQQLRICSKKKQIDRGSEDESNIGWSWLERWMATRVPDSISIEPRTNIQIDVATKNHTLVRKNRSFGVAGELESCASNDLPLQSESISETQEQNTKDLQTIKASISKRKSVPNYKSQRRHNRLQATKRDLQQQTKKAKKAKTTPSSCKMGNQGE
ncbi:Protein IQ-DOMAIN 33 [Cardamine amara subsp. amara]|uniref:Protein IQ-DOMAIN 33 n=1 Tax=Cardamine amara subsp. amara TaxID=228776 RepID=A0ABD1C8D4_CARAN